MKRGDPRDHPGGKEGSVFQGVYFWATSTEDIFVEIARVVRGWAKKLG